MATPLADEEVAVLRDMIAEFRAEKGRHATSLVQDIDGEIVRPILDVDPRAEKAARLGTYEGQLKALLAHLSKTEKQQAQEAITRSEQARAELDQSIQPTAR